MPEQPNRTELKTIPLTAVQSNPWQPRKTKPVEHEFAELIESVRALGQLTPIRVRPSGQKFQIVDGELRVTALRKLGKSTVLAIVSPMSDAEMRVKAFAQNVFVQMTSEDKEKYVGFVWTTDFEAEGKTIAEMSKNVGISQATLGVYIRAFEGRGIAVRLAAAKKTRARMREMASGEMAESVELLRTEPAAARVLIKADALTGENAREVMGEPHQRRVKAAENLVERESKIKREVGKRETELRRADVEVSQARERRENQARQSAEQNWRDAQAEEERRARVELARQEASLARVARDVTAEVQRIVANLANAMVSAEELDYDYLRPAIEIEQFKALVGEQLKVAVERLNAGPALAKKLKEAHTWVGW